MRKLVSSRESFSSFLHLSRLLSSPSFLRFFFFFSSHLGNKRGKERRKEVKIWGGAGGGKKEKSINPKKIF